MERRKYVFRIDALTPATLPMARLAEYLADLASLAGEKNCVHFDQVTEGSAQLNWWVEAGAEPRVRTRLAVADSTDAPRDIARPFSEIQRKLIQDGASAELKDDQSATILYFPGRSERAAETIPAFWQQDEIVGRLVRIGGSDESIHAQLQTERGLLTRFVMSEGVARRIVHHFLGDAIRLIGKAKWRRTPEGEWALDAFKVEDFEQLTAGNLLEDIARIRLMNPGRWVDADAPWEELDQVRYGEDPV